MTPDCVLCLLLVLLIDCCIFDLGEHSFFQVYSGEGEMRVGLVLLFKMRDEETASLYLLTDYKSSDT